MSIDGDLSITSNFLWKHGNKLPIKLKDISGNFECSYTGIESLKGFPEKVGGNFTCTYNSKLQSLEFCPKEVGGSFNCSANSLESLEFCPGEINGIFNCGFNRLTSLKFGPNVDGDYICCSNDLESLEGISCTGHVDCGHNLLTSLKHLPNTVSFCKMNIITNFDDLPQEYNKYIDLSGNPVYEIYMLFNRDPDCIYHIKEFDVIQGKNVIKDRLEEVFIALGKNIPKNITLNYYNLI